MLVVQHYQCVCSVVLYDCSGMTKHKPSTQGQHPFDLTESVDPLPRAPLE